MDFWNLALLVPSNGMCRKIYSSWVLLLLYVVDMDFFGDIAFFGKFMVVKVRLWNTYPERAEAPISFVPVPGGWYGGVHVLIRLCFTPLSNKQWSEAWKSQMQKLYD